MVVAADPLGVLVQSSHGRIAVGRTSASQVWNSVRGHTVTVLVVVTSMITSASSGAFARTLREWSGKRAAQYTRDLIVKERSDRTETKGRKQKLSK